MARLVEQLDAQIEAIFASWNVYTNVLAILLAVAVIYPLLTSGEPDTHPILLARQARPAPVRQPKESAVYRSTDVPHGYPLRSGLDVREPGAPRWTAGRDGDIRDIWRSAIAGGKDGERGLIMTVHGNEGAEDQSLDSITKQIVAIGEHLQETGSKTAIYLPNCVEYLVTVFACSFYGISAVLLPYHQPHELVLDLINRTGADTLVAAAGSLPASLLVKSQIKDVLWVVEKSSRHMGWADDDSKGSAPTMSTWHDLTAGDRPTVGLPGTGVDNLGTVTEIWLTKAGQVGKMSEFTQKNMIAAIAGLSTALPQRQRITASDLVLPADSFSRVYVLCHTLAALYSHASLAINSVAGPAVELALASRGVSPTVVIASAETLAGIHDRETASIRNGLQRFAHVNQSQAMSAGRMPTDGLLFKLLGPSSSSVKPGKLRLIFVAERAGTDSPALSSTMLSDLRIFTRARICYALTAPDVAGAVSQTNLFDYRRDNGPGHGHFGVPLASNEIKLVSPKDSDVAGANPKGEIVVSGPSVVGGEIRLGIQGQIRDDCTLAYV